MSSIEQLVEFIKDELLDLDDDESLGRDDELLVSGRIDSLGLMRMIAFITDELGTAVPYADIVLDNFRSVSHIENYLDSIDTGTTTVPGENNA